MKPTASRFVVASLLMASLLWGCSGSGLQGKTVATVNQDKISEQEFEDSYNRMLKLMDVNAQSLNDAKYAPMVDMIKKITLQNLIFTRLVEQEAEKQKLAVSDEEVQKVYQQQVQAVGGEKVLSDKLAHIGMSKEDYLEDLKNQLLKDKLVTVVGKNKIQVTEAEAQAFYKSHKSQFNQPEQVRARHILVAAQPDAVQQNIQALRKEAKPQEVQKKVADAIAEKKKKAETLLSTVKAHPDQFAALAMANSDDKESAKNGGDLSYFSKDMMVPAFSKAAFETKPGQIHNGIVETPFGYHIVQVLDRKPPQKKTFEQVKPKIKEILENQRRTRLMESWLAEEKKKAKIEIAPAYNFDKKMTDAAVAPKSATTGSAPKSSVQ